MLKNDNRNTKKIKMSEVQSIEDALNHYKEATEEYLELRLMSRQTEIKDYTSKKKIIKKNIARMLTYLKKRSV
jgi:ribosomal protein L29